MNIRTAVIMAAGRGIRMMPLTELIPKAMAPLLNTTLIAHGIKSIKNYVPQIYITVGYKGAQLAQHAIEHGVSGILNTEGKGNAWWIFNTLVQYLNEPIFVLTCDNVVQLDFEMLAQEYDAFDRPPCMVVPVVPISGYEGDYIFHKNNRVTELSREHKSDMYCSGIQVVNPGWIASNLEEYENFNEIWIQLIQKRKLFCSNLYPKKWYAVDTVQQLTEIRKKWDKE